MKKFHFMGNIYHLKDDNSNITITVKVGTIGNAHTKVRKLVGMVTKKKLAESDPSANGNIPTPGSAAPIIATSSQLIDSTLAVYVAITLVGIPKSQLEAAFKNLVVDITVAGGLDGKQIYKIEKGDKNQFIDKTMIVATKFIEMIP